jgi:hypothetical protein
MPSVVVLLATGVTHNVFVELGTFGDSQGLGAPEHVPIPDSF